LIIDKKSDLIIEPGAGNIDINSALKNIHTHYFIKFDTVGSNYISKQELIKELNKIT
jgi:hypothetical protein